MHKILMLLALLSLLAISNALLANDYVKACEKKQRVNIKAL